MTVEQKLDLLAQLMAQKELMELDKRNLIDSVMTPEIREKLAEIELEFSGKAADVTEKIDDLTSEIKAEVVALGQSVKGEYLHAVYTKGRVSWDSKKLDGLMIAIPALKEARKEGEPSISIRKV